MTEPTKMPADCRVESIAEFLHDHRHGEESWAFLLASGRDNGNLVETYRDLARAVRTLVEAKVREAAREAVAWTRFDAGTLAVARTKRGEDNMVECLVVKVVGAT